MARIRTIKPDAFQSDTLSSVSVLARWTFAGLWTYCDDEGRGRGDIRLVMAALFPIDDYTTPDDLASALDELADIGAICFYEVDGKDFLHCPKWGDHQKVSHAAKSKIPPCPKCSPENLRSPREELQSPPEGLRPERKGIEQGKGMPNSSGAGSDSGDFTSFWNAYPKKVAKGAARKAYAAALKKADAQTIALAAASFAQAQARTEQKFIPYPATWLNGERWADATPPNLVTSPLRPIQEIPEPPDGLSDAEYAEWWAKNRAAK